MGAVVESGECGDNLTWTLDEEGLLTISGSGPMISFENSDIPWYDQRDQIQSVTIQQGVTSIGDYSFENCNNLSSVNIANSIIRIGDFAFDSCSSLTSVSIPNSVDIIGWLAFGDCTSLTCMNVSEENSSYCSIEGVLFSKNQKRLISYPDMLPL